MESTVAIVVVVLVAVALLWVIFHPKRTKPTSPECITLRRRRGKPRIVEILGYQGRKILVKWSAKNGDDCFGWRTAETINRLLKTAP